MPAAPIILIDGSSYLFRAYHALPPLTTATGQPTGAIKGVISMIRSLCQQYPNSPVAVVFDTPGPTFRHHHYPQYKAHRPPMPDDLRVQIEPIHQLIQAMGLPLLRVDGVEADDVIGTLAQQASQAGLSCIISTGDKDLTQLVCPCVSLINTMTQEQLDVAGVQAKYGFAPAQMIDYLALMGDKVDNIPGVPGVGDKTARGLIQALGGLEAIYSDLQQVATLSLRGAKSLAAKLETHRDEAYLSYQLATIKCDVPLPLSLDALHNTPPDTAQLKRLFSELEFRSWLAQLESESAPATAVLEASPAPQPGLDAPQAPSPANASPQYHCVQQLDQLQALEQQLNQAQQMAVLFITEPGHYLSCALQGIALATMAHQAWYIPLRSHLEPVLPQEQVIAMLKPQFERYGLQKITHDLKRTLHCLANLSMQPANSQQDVLLQAFVLNSTLARHASLDKHFDVLGIDNLIRQYLPQSTPPPTLADVCGAFGVKQKNLADIALEQACAYAAGQADYTLQLHNHLSEQLAAQPELQAVYQHIEAPLVAALTQVERQGTLIDADYLHQLSSEFTQQMQALEIEAHQLAGTVFNLNSTQQLGQVLFERLQLPVLKKTPKGQPSTNEAVLSELAQQYELPRQILRHRHLRKLVSTYTDPLPLMIHPKTQRVHTTYHQAGAQTGRFSSTDPNLQNIPIRSAEGRAIRKAFIAPPKHCILAADYSQIELRIMAHLSQDAGLIEAFAQQRDIHRTTAAQILGIEADQVSDTQRRNAKAINFGLIYGMSAFGLAQQLGIGRHEAQAYVDRYFEQYPGVQRYMQHTRAQALEQGYVDTLFGRRLYLPDLASRQVMVRKAAERTAINAPMQGSAADIIKRAMIDVQQWLHSQPLQAKLIMQVHDELVFEVAQTDVEALSAGVRLRMQCAANLAVPLVVDIGHGRHWDQAH